MCDYRYILFCNRHRRDSTPIRQLEDAQERGSIELGAMVSNLATAATSDPESSVSQRVQAVNAILVQSGSWSNVDEADGDWLEEWCYDWEGDWTDDWYGEWWWTAPEEQPSEWHEDESSYLVCGVIGSSPKQQCNEKAKLMTDKPCNSQKRIRPTILREPSCVTFRTSKLRRMARKWLMCCVTDGTSRILVAHAACKMVANERRSVKTVPRQRLRCSVSMSKCYFHLASVTLEHPQLAPRVAPISAAESE